ncbi:hypothetical protein ACFVH7_17860 [Kitasatospora indigofera]|uniref:hypothetical protein n=1 Tax=Kitasatospora indigofera TaxID=67307 RepID=UPI0036292AA1
MLEISDLFDLFDLMPAPTDDQTLAPARTSVAEAFYYPRAAAAVMEANLDAAFDRYGTQVVARFAFLEASPHVQLGGRGR